MKTIFETLKSLGNVTAVISTTNAFTQISVRPNTVGIDDPALDYIKPFQVRIEETDTEEDVCNLILEHLPKAIKVVDSIKQYEESVKLANTQKAEEKAKAEVEKKELEKLNKEYAALKEILESDVMDEFDHTKALNKFKTTFSNAKMINELEDIYNKKYNKLTLF